MSSSRWGSKETTRRGESHTRAESQCVAKVALTEQSLLRDIPQIDHEESVVESMHTEQVHPVSEVLSKAQHETGATNDSSSEVDYSDAHTPQTTDRVINPI